MFDPNLPKAGTDIDAVQMRSQLNGLKALIDALPTVTGTQVDAVNTLPPGSAASVTLNLTGSVLHFTFGIPRGEQGDPGADGGEGPPGPPFANAVVDNVSTLEPGDPAFVNVTFDGTDVRFDIGIPRGNDGAEGPPGEVSTQDLQDAMEGTSNNSNSVDTLGQTAETDYSQGQMQDVLNKLDELIQALRR